MSYKPLFIDVHVLQTVPPSCINRDDTGSPKTARFGGVRRARVSSQAWKRAVRDEFARVLPAEELGYRTKKLVDLVSESIMSQDNEVDQDAARKMAEAVIKATGIKIKDGQSAYLVFIARRQVEALAKLAVDANREGAKIAPKEAKAILNIRERPSLNAVDVAMFGRMVADTADLNVDASVQVAHALGVSASDSEFDYYTALDDLAPADNPGADMIGTVEFLSDTLYRYATIDVRHLYANLGSGEVAEKAVEAFLKAFVCSMPTGKLNTFANRTLPTAVLVQVRESQPVSLVGAFERPVFATGEKGVSEIACERLVAQAQAVDEAFGTKPSQAWCVCGTPFIRDAFEVLGMEPSTIDNLASEAASVARSYLRADQSANEG